MKFRKKPVVIDAVQLTWSNWDEICDFVHKDYFVSGRYIHPKTLHVEDNPKKGYVMGLEIKTLEGNHFALENDWIIKGIHGEFYPIKNSIFEKTYEKVI